jgi:uncharacterized Zn-finger protein
MSTGKQPANTRKEYVVTKKNLPLSCPTEDMVLWNSHPRVFLPIEKTHREVCPYCGATFVLKDDS